MKSWAEPAPDSEYDGKNTGKRRTISHHRRRPPLAGQGANLKCSWFIDAGRFQATRLSEFDRL